MDSSDFVRLCSVYWYKLLHLHNAINHYNYFWLLVPHIIASHIPMRMKLVLSQQLRSLHLCLVQKTLKELWHWDVIVNITYFRIRWCSLILVFWISQCYIEITLHNWKLYFSWYIKIKFDIVFVDWVFWFCVLWCY